MAVLGVAGTRGWCYHVAHFQKMPFTYLNLCERCPWSCAVYKNNGDPFGVNKIKEKTSCIFETGGNPS